MFSNGHVESFYRSDPRRGHEYSDSQGGFENFIGGNETRLHDTADKQNWLWLEVRKLRRR